MLKQVQKSQEPDSMQELFFPNIDFAVDLNPNVNVMFVSLNERIP